MKKILFVDDEQNILQGLRRMLRPMKNEWDMTFAIGGEEAIALIDSNIFEVIVTDMRMPGVDGSQVLEHIKKKNPSAARIVLSGQTDKEEVLKSTGTAHQYIAKPCDAELLKLAVGKACQLRDLLLNQDVAAVVAGVDSLPSLPQIYVELTAEMNVLPEELSIKRIGEIINKDIAMIAKVLQLSNSAFFGLSREVETAEQAVMMLGTEIIRSLVLSDAVFKSFNQANQNINLQKLWDHSFTVGALSKSLAVFENADQQSIDQSFQAGVLHDIGQLILATSLNDVYRDICLQASSQSVPLYESELMALNCDHGQVGAYLLGLWGLPNSIVEAVAFHHQPEKSLQVDKVFSPLVAVHVANAFSHYLDGDKNALETMINKPWLDSIGFGGKIAIWLDFVTSKLHTQSGDL